MDAAQLVEQRKAGKITQEEFFIALNQLRRANCSSTGAKSVSREATANKSAVKLGDRKPRRNVTETNPEAGGDRASRSMGGGEKRIGVTALIDFNEVSPPRSCRSDEKMQQFTAEPDDSARVKTCRDLNAGWASGSLTETVNYRRRPLPPGKFAEGDQLAGDSGWLFSPLGQTEIYCQRRLRKTPELRGTHYRGSKTMTTRTLYGDSAAPSDVQSPKRTKARFVDSWTPQRPWRPVGGFTPLSYEEVIGSCYNRSSAVKCSRSLRNDNNAEMAPTTVTLTQRAKGEGDTHVARFVNEDNDCSRSASREQSPVTMPQSRDEKKRGLATEAGGRTSVIINETIDTSPILDNTSAHSLHGGYNSSNTAPRCQESNGQTSFTAYENLSRRESPWSLDSGRYYTKARVDRYGYPLHKNEEDLISTEVAGDMAGLLFAPMIKGLPYFYRGRSSKQGSSRFTTEECYSGQPIPFYERAMDWKVKADELRARRLAKREEMEIADCTFQPNVLRRRFNAASCRNADTVRSTPRNRPGEGGERGSSGRANEPEKGREKVAVVASQRLFEASKRLKERRSEEQERKKMWEEEKFARSCTFQPSLMRAAGSRSHDARARYMDPPTKPAGPVGKALDHSQTFRPKIVGVKPSMVRAIEYVSVDVAERLHRRRPINSQPTEPLALPPESFMNPEGGGVTSSPEMSEADRQYRPPCCRYGDAEEPDGEALTRSRPDTCYRRGGNDHSLERQPRGPFYPHHDARGEGNGIEDFGRSRDDHRDHFCFEQRQPQEGRGVMCSSCGGPIAEQESSSAFIKAADLGAKVASHYRRPHSAPASSTGRVGVRREWRDRPRVEQSAINEWVPGSWGGMGEWRRRRGKGTIRRERNGMGAVSMVHGDGRESSNRPPERQAAISFQEFLVRQARSQAAAGQRLNRLKSLHSPSFTPQLSRGTRRLAARNGPSAGGGTFKERLDLTKRRRSLGYKAAISKAMAKQKEACTFSPRLTSRSNLARSRSARERSIGDSVLKAAKQHMARAREDIKLLDGPGADNCTFTPILATAGDALAPRASSRLRLAAELDTYMERVQDAATQRDEKHFEQQRRAIEEEDRACTFRPELTECPELVRRTAAGMRRIRAFREKEALRLNKVPVPKPNWR